jgi:foldase protein PrsA
MEDYQKQVAQVEAFFEQEGLELESEEGRERLAQARRQVLEQMIDQELIRQAAVEMDVSISGAELESHIQEIVEQSGGQEQFTQSLQATGASYDDFRQMLLDQLLSEAIFSALTASIDSVAEQVHARHILLPTRERAEEVLTRLQTGEDFAFLAGEYSEDVSSRERGGDMGFFPRSVMPDNRIAIWVSHCSGIGEGGTRDRGGDIRELASTGFHAVASGAERERYH